MRPTESFVILALMFCEWSSRNGCMVSVWRRSSSRSFTAPCCESAASWCNSSCWNWCCMRWSSYPICCWYCAWTFSCQREHQNHKIFYAGQRNLILSHQFQSPLSHQAVGPAASILYDTMIPSNRGEIDRDPPPYKPWDGSTRPPAPHWPYPWRSISIESSLEESFASYVVMSVPGKISTLDTPLSRAATYATFTYAFPA